MKTPSHWKGRNYIAGILYPLGWLYNLATHLNIRFSKPKQVTKPVICIGNLSAGGTGKTPVAVSVASILQGLNKKPFFVSRGYGGSLKNIIVNNQQHLPTDVGDEPLLLSRQAPVVVNSDRYEGALTAIKNGADVIVMDDGFQNPGLKKDLSFLVFDGGFGYGNGYGIPAGPLRESLADGLKRADAIIIIGKDEHNLKHEFSTLPIFEGLVAPKPVLMDNKKVVAFAGIGRPEKFYNSLKELGFEVKETYDFPDHHQYKIKELKNLIDRAETLGAELYTTAKDFVKIPQILQPRFKVLEIEIRWQNNQALTDFLRKQIS